MVKRGSSSWPWWRRWRCPSSCAAPASPEEADDTVVIITPHNEAIRHEFSVGFREWYKARTGRTSSSTGGWSAERATSRDISRGNSPAPSGTSGPPGSEGPGAPRSRRATRTAGCRRTPRRVKDARRRSWRRTPGAHRPLFGGGSYDFAKQAQAGRLVDSGVAGQHPDWFAEDVLPRTFEGEEYWDRGHLWFGTVLSSYASSTTGTRSGASVSTGSRLSGPIWPIRGSSARSACATRQRAGRSPWPSRT